MEDIYEFDMFDYGNFFNFWSFFVIIFLIFLYFVYIFLKNRKKEIEVVFEEKIEKKDFLSELQKIEKNEFFLENILHLFTLFLEEKSWNKNISKMTFKEIKNLKLENNLKQIFEKIYFLKYSKKDVLETEKEKIFNEVENIFFLNNLEN